MNSIAHNIDIFTQKANSYFLSGMQEDFTIESFEGFEKTAHEFNSFLKQNSSEELPEKSIEQKNIFKIQEKIVSSRIAFESIETLKNLPQGDYSEFIEIAFGEVDKNTINSFKNRYNKNLAKYIEKFPDNKASLESNFVEIAVEVAA